ncbi:MAG TPA: hypothetical protein VEK35_11165 [Roseiarcus sp.]|nr:hypothetical protein [Roseiarcus sp.]
MPWYAYLLQFLSGLLLANGAPHFLRGVSGERFQSPFATPPGVGESSPIVNVVWGFANFAVGFALLRGFQPEGADAFPGWLFVGAGVLVAGVFLARHFGAVRSKKS